MPQQISVTEYAYARGWSRERVVRALLTKKLKGTYDRVANRWTVDASELDGAIASVGSLSAPDPAELEVSR